MKKFFLKVALAASLLTVSLVAGAVTYGPLDITDWKISSIKPTSFSSLDGSVDITLTSKAKYTLSGISGVIYTKSGEMFVIGSADNFVIPKGTSTITVYGHGSLSSYSVLLSLLKNPSLKPADYTADINVTVRRGVMKPHVVTMSRVPLSRFLK